MFIFGVLLLPFLGTVLGAALVFFLWGSLPAGMQSGLSGFSAGVMAAASIWSLILPALEFSSQQGIGRLITVVLGFWCGLLSLLAVDLILRLKQEKCQQNKHSSLQKHHSMTVLAVCIHNFPEGMAVGAVAASWMQGKDLVSAAALLALAMGMAVQNVPEGAIVSLPMCSQGVSRGRAFAVGVLSAIIESAGTFFAIILAAQLATMLPFLLCFAAGAMIYVVVRELIPEAQAHGSISKGSVLFGVGFSLMMILDVLFG